MQVKLQHETPGNVKRLQNDQLTREIRRAAREFFVESLSTNQVARVNKATIRSKLSFMRWYTEIPLGQDKAGETPHTLQERRPRNNSDIQQDMQRAYSQQTGQQRVSLSRREWKQELKGVAGLQEAPETPLPVTQNLGPGPFTFTYYGEAELWRLMTSIIPSEHQEMMHLQEGVWHQNEHANSAEQFIRPETRTTRQRPKQDNTTQLHPNITAPPKTDKKENYTIKDAWINLIQAEDYLIRGITAFLPRIQQEETSPTFEHPEDWG